MVGRNALTISFSLLLLGCTGSGGCNYESASNKVLALGKAQGRWLAETENKDVMETAIQLGMESGAISELIAQSQYQEACAKADEVAKKYGIDLEKEQKGMVTIQQLAKDGGKGAGSCSIADASKKQMELHGLIQAAVTAGKKDSSAFTQFNDDTKSFSSLLSTNPSGACELIDNLKKQYGL